MFNPFTLISTVREKILFCVALLLVGLALGWHLHSMWDAWLNSGNLRAQLVQAQEAPGKIIDFHQKLKKTNVQNEECYNKPLPPAVLNLLH